MGNQMSVPQKVEDQENESDTDTHKVTSESECDQNGMPVIISTHTVQYYDEVDLGISVKQDNGTTSSPKTMEISTIADASGKNLGKEAKPKAPAAKSRFFLTLSQSVPGRTGDQATDSSTAPVKLDVSSNKMLGNKDPSESMALPVAAATRPDPNKTPGQTPAHGESFAANQGPVPFPPESEGKISSNSKDSSFLDKLFKLDKGREEAPSVTQQKTRSIELTAQAGDIPGCSKPSNDDAETGKDIVDNKVREGQEITPSSCSLPQGPEEQEVVIEDPQTTNTTENSNSIMSFFKTLVSPNKAETKKDLEDTASKAEIVCDGQVGQKTSDIQAKGTKKKHLHSPRLGLAFRKFFRHKGAEQSPTTSTDLKSDKVNFVPQENQGTAKNPTTTETAKEGAKEKGNPTSLPLGKLFWKKSVKEESVPPCAEENVVCESPIEVTKSEEVDSALQTVDLNEEEATPEPTEEKPKREERKPPRTSLMTFLRQMSVKGDGGITHSEDINEKDLSYQTSDSTEKATTPSPPAAEPEPVATVNQKSKECSLKDKKPAAENSKQKNNKQEAKEPTQVVEPAVVELNSLQNGDKTRKKPEKRRQSLGGFLKGLGPKRMLDAQVQTDPVSIGPVGKSK
ncbi:breast carcinoma-amplified sequence 1 [Erinaceus europaeus]|uniref:Breast carcinoma-amplified sequence 1 n=1 Tax=Erinaceus europaeus TaxID=9365 RepID=A0ABM3WWZ8_ERIEU|nr:breast carcinoma-amplified sequence 1 [Erinaceus europaeus]